MYALLKMTIMVLYLYHALVGNPLVDDLISFPLQIKLAQSAHLRLKTLRHPNILRYIDGVEVKQSISFIAWPL